MQITRISQLEACRKIASQWDCMTRGSVFRRAAWLHNWWRYYGQQHDLFVLAVHDNGGQLVGLAPWYLEASVRHGRVVRALGDGDVCSDHIGIMATPEHAEDVALTLARWMTAASQGATAEADRWHSMDIHGVDADDSLFSHFVDHMHGCGNHVRRQEAFRYWRAALPATWDAYLASVSKSRRKVLRRWQRQYFDTGRAVVQVITSAEQWPTAMQTFVELHQRRRHSLGEPGCFADPQFSGFLHAAADGLRAVGVARLYLLELDGRQAAADFSLLDGETLYAYQSGVEPALLAEGPGSLLQLAVFQDAIRQRCRSLDFLRGDEPYKARWNAEPASGLEIRIVSRNASAQLRHHAWVAGDAMKQWIKSGLAATGVV